MSNDAKIQQIKTAFGGLDRETKKRLSMRPASASFEPDISHLANSSDPSLSSNLLFEDERRYDIPEYIRVVESVKENPQWSIQIPREVLLNPDIRLKEVNRLERCQFLYDTKKYDDSVFEKITNRLNDVKQDHQKCRLKENTIEHKLLEKLFEEHDKSFDKRKKNEQNEMIKAHAKREKNSKKFGINSYSESQKQEFINELMANIANERKAAQDKIETDYGVERIKGLRRSYANKHQCEILIYEEFHKLELVLLQTIEKNEMDSNRKRWEEEKKILEKKQKEAEKELKKTTNRDIYMAQFREEQNQVSERQKHEEDALLERQELRADAVLLFHLNTINQLKDEYLTIENSCVLPSSMDDIILESNANH